MLYHICRSRIMGGCCTIYVEAVSWGDVVPYMWRRSNGGVLYHICRGGLMGGCCTIYVEAV